MARTRSLNKKHRGDVCTMDLVIRRNGVLLRQAFLWGKSETRVTSLMDYILKYRGDLAIDAERRMPDPWEARNSCASCLVNIICPSHGGRAVEVRSLLGESLDVMTASPPRPKRRKRDKRSKDRKGTR